MKQIYFIFGFSIFANFHVHSTNFPTPPCIEFERLGLATNDFCLGEMCTLGYCTDKDILFYRDKTVKISKGCHANNHFELKGQWQQNGDIIEFNAFHQDTIAKCIEDSKNGPGFESESASRKMCTTFFRKFTNKGRLKYELKGAAKPIKGMGILVTAKYFVDGKEIPGPIEAYSSHLNEASYKCFMGIQKEVPSN